MTSNICLIVCFYKGLREGNQGCDFLNYINTHKLSLNNLQHNLSNIVFVISQDIFCINQQIKTHIYS